MTGKAGDLTTPPEHYRNDSGIQPFDVIDAYHFGYYSGHAMKYLLRWNKKDDPIDNLEKARHYFQEIPRRELVLDDMFKYWYIPTRLSMTRVIEAFGLTGHVAGATRCLLFWGLARNNIDLEDGIEYIDAAIKEVKNDWSVS